ncbi:MAG TPA: alkaline phosphatase PhoX [Candidatus Binatia bacterium]|nr:alkaline phosphatase PhoX [Candidatus Binatia bacterium]
MRPKYVVALTTVVVSFAAGAALAVPPNLTDVPDANPKAPGFAAPNVLSPELKESIVAQGATPLENSSQLTNFYGYDNDGPMLPAPGAVQSPGHNVEATKTEPDKNTYLVLEGQHGADPDYDYGTHFLFQGHENGQGGQGYITRINLDADGAHRVTLLATTDKNGNSFPTIDGSTWDPWAQRLLFTTENGSKDSVWQATPDYPSTVESISGAVGRGGYEGIQNDSDGNLWIVEDVGGKTGLINTHAKQPNSFLYRFIPKDRSNLTQGGRLQALQVLNHQGRPIVFHPGNMDADILSQDVKDLHTYGQVFNTRWVTIHDTAIDGNTPFDANALAKANDATPFKRPENGQFRPGSHFTEFFFDETGDTNAQTEAGVAFGGFGAIFKLFQANPSAINGRLTIFYRCDVAHSGFDNVGFWSKDEVVFVEDAGDTLHTQRNALDSAYLFDVTLDYSNPINQPIRILAEGRDASATIDSGIGSISGNGFQNDGDNEITGFHVSDGDPTPGGILGARNPHPFVAGWRVFYTQQHGDNNTWEIVPVD